MAIDFMEFLKETFENAENLDLEQVKTLAIETKAFFDELEKVLAIGDAKEKEEAVRNALEIKEFLDFKAESLAKKSGFSMQEFQEMMKNPPKLNEEDNRIVTEISNNLEEVNNIKNKKRLKTTYLS